MHPVKRFFLILFILIVVSFSSCLLWVSRHYVVPVMMYHNVEATKENKPNWVSPEIFEMHMAYLEHRGYDVIHLDELVDAIKSGRKLARDSVVITFDDGYANNYYHAFDILKKYNFPATVFVPSDSIGDEGRLTKKQLKEMAEYGITIGSHTKTEAYLPEIKEGDLQQEIAESKWHLEEVIDVPVDFLAYPIGGFSEPIKKIVQEVGYKAAFTTNRGFDRYNEDLFELKRIRFSNNDDRNEYLWVKLSGYYNIFRKSKNPF